MFQCLGLGNVETGGCGEDWYHPECLVGLPRDWHVTLKKAAEDRNKDRDGKNEKVEEKRAGSLNGEGKEEEPISTADDQYGDEDPPLPPGFPDEDDFETFICYKCLDANPWLKRYAGTLGFLPPVFRNNGPDPKPPVPTKNEPEREEGSKKRKVEVEHEETGKKRAKSDPTEEASTETMAPPSTVTKEKHEFLPNDTPSKPFSLFVKEDFRDYLCRCAACFPSLVPHPQLREEEETYEPPLSDAGDDVQGGHSAGSQHTGSLLDRGEAALSNLDRVRAIEGAMVYNHLRTKVKEFLKPFAESGTPVGAEDIKEYFEKLRGDEEAIREAAARRNGAYTGSEDGGSRREQSGKS